MASRRTPAHHIGAALQEIGVRSRRELIQRRQETLETGPTGAQAG